MLYGSCKLLSDLDQDDDWSAAGKSKRNAISDRKCLNTSHPVRLSGVDYILSE